MSSIVFLSIFPGSEVVTVLREESCLSADPVVIETW
jgi:hypothetical protein